MRRLLSVSLSWALVLSSVPHAAAQTLKPRLPVDPQAPSIGSPSISAFQMPSVLPVNSPPTLAVLSPAPGAPFAAVSVALAVPGAPAAALPVHVPVAAVQASIPLLPVAHAVGAATPPQAAPSAPVLSPSALFDGVALRSPAAGDLDDEPVTATPVAREPRVSLSARFTSRLARWTGAAAVWSVYRDGVLVQRHAARLNDRSLTPARRVVSARVLGSLNRIETLPTLELASESDPSAKVRGAALTAVIRIARAAEPKLVRSLKTSLRASTRQLSATMLSHAVRHGDSPAAVEALSVAAALDVSEDVRLAAIRSLSLASSPRALASLEWMLVKETRPHMRSALELAVVEARGRGKGLVLHAYQPPADELSDARGALHAVALKRALAVSLVFVAVEMIGGFVTGNVALKADAMHLAADQLINAAALFSIWIARRPPNSRKSYGYLKVESIVGLLGSAAIAYMGFEMGAEAWQRLFTPGAPAIWSVALFALASLAANLFSALILWRHHGESLSMKGAFLHSMTDAIGSFGVIVSVAAAILLGWAWLEPVAVALIVVMIVKTAWELGKPAWEVLIDAVPAGVVLDRVEADLLAIPGAAVVKDLHVWSLNSRTKALTATILIRAGAGHDAVLASAKAVLAEKHDIRHVTVQVETLP